MNHSSCFPMNALLALLLPLSLFADERERQEKTAAVSWRCVGPGGGGWIQSILASRYSSSRIYVGSDVGGFYRSDDGGQSYTIHNSGLRNPYIECITEHPCDTNILYAGSRGGVYRSEDGGFHWKELRNGFPPISTFSFTRQISKIVFSPDSPDTVYAAVGQPRERTGGRGEIYRSDDAGNTWRQIVPKGVLDSDLNIYDFLIHPKKPERFLISTQRGIFLSTDAGTTWRACNAGLPRHLRTRRLAQSPARPETIFVSLNGKAGETPWQAGVYRSDDAGESWTACNSGFRQVSGKPSAKNTLCTWVDCLAIHPTNPDIVYAGGASWVDNGVYKTTNGGQHWEKVLRKKPSGWISFWGTTVTCLSLSRAAPDTLVFGTAGIIARTEDGGGTWMQRYTQERRDDKISGSGLEVTCLHSITPHPNRKGLFYLGYFDIGLLITEDSGRSFRRCVKGIPPAYNNSCFCVAPSFRNPLRLWAGFGNWGNKKGIVAESLDGGATWEPLDQPGNGWSNSRPRALTLLRETPDGATLCCVADGLGVRISEDSGKTWQPRNSGLPEKMIRSLAADGEILYAGTKADAKACGEVYRSDTLGRSWRRITPDSFRLGDINHIEAKKGYIVVTAGRRYERAYGVLEGGAWRSVDGGSTWTKIYDARFCYAAVFHPKSPERIFLGMADHPYHDHCTGEGIRETQDGGKTWRSLNSDSLSCLNIRCLVLDPFEPDHVWAGTGGNSVFVGRVRK